MKEVKKNQYNEAWFFYKKYCGMKMCDAEWEQVNAEAQEIVKKYGGDLFTQLKNGQHDCLSKEGIRGAIAAIKTRAAMERRVYPHLFRKTTATNIVKRGGSVHDAGEYLGHKDRTTAGKHYAFVGNDHTVEIFKRYVAAV